MIVSLELSEGDMLMIDELHQVVEIKEIRDSYVTVVGDGAPQGDVVQARNGMWKGKFGKDEFDAFTISMYSDERN